MRPPDTREGFARYLRAARSPRQDSSLIVTESGEFVGVINVNEIVRGVFQSGYLGYYAFVPAAGTGLFRRGFESVLRRVFCELHLHRVEANIQPGNARSRRLVERAGFSLEGHSPRYLQIAGQWRDHDRWALLVEDWREQSPANQS